MPERAAAKAPTPAAKGSSEPLRRPALTRAGPIHPVLRLQQTVGNRAVGRMLEARGLGTREPLPAGPAADRPVEATEPESAAPLTLEPAAPVARSPEPEPPEPVAASAVPEPVLPAAPAVPAPAPVPPEPAAPAAPEALAAPAAVEEAVSAPGGGAGAAPAGAAAEAAAEGGPEAAEPAQEVPAAAPEAGEAAAAPGAAGAAAPGERAPASPEEDPAFQAVVAKAGAVAEKQRSHEPAGAQAGAAQAAAVGPPNEVAAQAAGAQVEKIDAQEPRPFDRAAFKAALLEKIAAITPKNLEEADEFEESGRAGMIKGEVVSKVGEGKEAAQAAIATTAQEAPDPSGFEPKPVIPLAPAEAGRPPPELGAAAAAPKPKTESEVSLEKGSRSLDQEMGDADVTEDQLARSNEPEFQAGLDAKREAQTHAAEAPAAYRADEQAVLGGAEGQAEAAALTETQAMHEARSGLFAQVVGEQGTTRSEDETRRAEVAGRIEEIYQATKEKVEARLAALDGEVNEIFDTGAEAARVDFESHVQRRMSAYKSDRYSGVFGGARWLKDKLLGMPDEVNEFYREGRDLYLARMDTVIDRVAAAVEAGLTEAKELVASGRQEVQDYVEGLPEDLRRVGEDAAGRIQSKFDALEQSVVDKQAQLIDSLAQKYKDNLAKVDARIEEMKAANRGLVDAALGAIKAIIETLRKLKNMLLDILAKAAGVIGAIVRDPIGFVGNLVSGVKMGLKAFISNLGTHLKEGLLAWLFGELGEAGIQLPESFDLKGILSLVLQVLGLTYANIRARAVAIVGEPVVQALEQAAEVFKILVTEGPAGLWRFIRDKLGELKETVLEGIKSFVMERVIIAGITWIVGLLNPASAFIKACKAIYDIVMFFIQRASQIAALINAILDSMAAIAAGSLAAMAAAVENALAKAIPVVIGFLAALLGLGGIGAKIREIVERIRAPINAAIDWVIHQAVKLVKAAGKLVVGLVKPRKPEDEEPDQSDPEKAAKVEAGLAAIDQAEQARLEDGEITKEKAEEVAAQVKAQHPVFSSLRVVDGGETWDYEYSASAARKKKGEKQQEDQDVMDPVSIRFICKTKYDPTEYRKQLDGQQAGLNKMTVEQWLANRGAFLARAAAAGSGRDPKGAKAQETFRKEERERLILLKIKEEKRTRGQAEKEVDAFLKTQAALHDPDQVAAGEATLIKGLGSRRINSSIGSQWRTRVVTLDAAVKKVPKTKHAKTRLNVQLEMDKE